MSRPNRWTAGGPGGAGGISKADADATYGQATGALSNAPLVTSVAVTEAAHRSVYIAQSPCSVYDATSRKTFLAYLGPLRSLYVKEYDHATGVWSEPVYVAPYATAVEDDHGAPSLAIDGTGRLNIVFGTHGTTYRYARSNSPRTSAGDWTVTDLSGIAVGTYASIAFEPVSGRLYLFDRAGAAHGSTFPAHEFGRLAYTVPGSGTWTDLGGLIDTRAAFTSDTATDCYAASLLATGGRLWLTFFIAHGSGHDGTRSDVYVTSYDPADGTFRNAAGTSQGTSLATTAKFTAIRAHQGDWVSGLRTLVEADGTVLTAFTRLDATVTPSRTRTSVARFAAGAWATAETGLASNHLYHSSAIRRRDGGGYEAWGMVGRATESATWQPSSQEAIAFVRGGADLGYSTSPDGVTWTSQGVVLPATEVKGAGLMELQAVLDGRDDLRVLTQPMGPGTVTGSSRVGNASNWAAPIYAVGGKNINVARALRRVPTRPRSTDWYGDDVYAINASGADGAQTVAPTAWTAVDLSALVPPGTSEVTLILGTYSSATSTSGRVVWSFRSGESSGGSICDVSTRQEWTDLMHYWTIRVPVSPSRTIAYKCNIGSTQRLKLRIAAAHIG